MCNYNNLDEYTKFLIKYATKLNIKYYLVNSKSDINYIYDNNILNVSTINTDSSDIDKIKEILIHSEKNNTYMSFIPNTFRITSIYNIPDRNKIIAGIQTNGILSYDSNSYIVYPDMTHNKITIESIFKKYIDSINIYEKETGSISYKSNQEKNQITKNCIITDDIGLEYINNVNNKEFKLNVLKIYDNLSNIQNAKYYLINCNVSYLVNVNLNINLNIIDITIECNQNLLLQDNVCILIPVEFKDFNQIILCEVIY